MRPLTSEWATTALAGSEPLTSIGTARPAVSPVSGVSVRLDRLANAGLPATLSSAPASPVCAGSSQASVVDDGASRQKWSAFRSQSAPSAVAIALDTTLPTVTVCCWSPSRTICPCCRYTRYGPLCASIPIGSSGIPILTVLGLTAAVLISGAVVTETVFGLPGVGNLVVSAVLRRDYPVIQGALLVIAALYVLINFAIDMLYLLVDPRVRY